MRNPLDSRDARVAPEMMSEAENRSGLADRRTHRDEGFGLTRGKPDPECEWYEQRWPNAS